MTAKVDFKRDLDCYKAKRDTPQVVTVPDLQYLMIDGHGDPNTAVFAVATTALYPVAYKGYGQDKHETHSGPASPCVEALARPRRRVWPPERLSVL